MSASSLEGKYVPPAGRSPNKVLLVGEAPGEQEAEKGCPFVGRSGQEQDRYVEVASGGSVAVKNWYRTNVVKEYTPGNPDPTPEQIAHWSPVLETEIREVDPAFIIAVGRFATRWFLGDVHMDVVHGIPHRWNKRVVIPVYHPAAGLYNTDLRALIAYDYGVAVATIKKDPTEIKDPVDALTGKEVYEDVGGRELIDLTPLWVRMGLDTEGTPVDPWSIQVSPLDGFGFALRCSDPDFKVGVEALQRWVDAGGLLVLHNAMYDIPMCRAMGLDLHAASMFDTMVAAYLLRIEPQALKALAYRWTGMRVASYRDTVGGVGRDKQVEYLVDVASRSWPSPEPRVVTENDGTSRLYQPKSVVSRAEKILADVTSGRRDKDDREIDPLRRWMMVDTELREPIEAVLGPMREGTLDDIPLKQAIEYACRDADATLRLHAPLRRALTDQGLADLMVDGMRVLPIFEEMQATGMTASVSKFEELLEYVEARMCAYQSRISSRYFGGRPFNPGSPKHVATLMRRRGLVGEKRTSTGKVSTAKKSIEHLRHTDPAIDAVISWRECEKVRDTFCLPLLERVAAAGKGADIAPIRCQIKTTRVTTRRLAAAEPNLLQIPVKTDLGRRVRDCFVAPEGQLFGAWDLSQIEMRVMAHESRDELLCKLFREGRDIHAETASRVFGIDIADVDKMKHRYPAKRTGFGIIYGISGHGLVDQFRMEGQTQWSERDCGAMISEWLRVYSGVADYIKDTARKLREDGGVVRDRWGMIRYLPGVFSSDRKTRSEAERMAVAHKIQGGAQGMIQRSMIRLAPAVEDIRQCGDVRWCLQVHDEIVLRFDEDLFEALNDVVLDALTTTTRLRVPVEADGGAARSWGELK